MKSSIQQLLDQFKGDIQFKRYLKKGNPTPDEYVDEIETNQGIFVLYETDYLSDFSSVTQRVKQYVGTFSHFIEVKVLPETFEETPGAKYYTSYPPDFEQFKKYLTWRSGSYYYAFLIKK